jgi:hypothetical protein
MKLPSATERAALKLADPAQRLVWGLLQLWAGMYANPAIANTTQGIKAIATGSGIKLNTPTKPLFAPRYDKLSDRMGLGGMEGTPTVNALDIYTAWIPLEPALIAQGLDFQLCAAEVTAEKIVPITPPTTGDPIPDNSTSTTIEQYIIEQYRAYLDNAIPVSNSANFPLGDSFLMVDENTHYEEFENRFIDWNQGDTWQTIPVLKLRMPLIPVIPTTKTETEVTGWLGDASSKINPYNYCSLGNYLAFRDALTLTP